MANLHRFGMKKIVSETEPAKGNDKEIKARKEKFEVGEMLCGWKWNFGNSGIRNE